MHYSPPPHPYKRIFSVEPASKYSVIIMTAPFDICVLDDQVTSIGSNELDDFQWNMSEFDGSKGCVIERTVPHDG